MTSHPVLTFWSPFPFVEMQRYKDFFRLFFSEVSSIITIDCSYGYGAVSKQLLNQSDLVLIFLPGEESYLNSYFSFPLVKKECSLFIICNYFSWQKISIQQLITQYRLETNQVLLLPFHLLKQLKVSHINSDSSANSVPPVYNCREQDFPVFRILETLTYNRSSS